ncbi:MAG: hypothetical protein JSS82_10340 [Bacteroidetes bacterium]|nr:hypothetical protein [Bacteroidota bacterium]
MKEVATFRNNYLQQETQMWLRSLDFIQQENIHLKNSLADILKVALSDGMLEEAEYFQNQFLNKDTVIALLRRDIALQSQELERKSQVGEDADKKSIKQQEKLRSDIEKMEKEFSKLKFQFNNYLSASS